MRFLVDECTGSALANWLREEGHDVFSVYEDARGITDDEVIKKAFSENRVLITNDKDFGEKVFREKRPHHGVIFMRLENERSFVKIDTIKRFLSAFTDQIQGQFAVVTEDRVRFASAPTPSTKTQE